jgi:ABC-2 type transport system ATP-binding protein
MLDVKHLSKRFWDIKAVDNLSFRVKNGEVLGIIGPNGAGKTTALECICSVYPPDSGTILINGKDIYREPVEAKQGLAYVPEIPEPYSNLTLEEHIEFTARIFEMTDWEKKADELIKRFDLDEERQRFPEFLSKGQKQKLNIICAFIHEPTVILMDEPLYGIDPRGGKELKKLVKQYQARGASIVISSHMLSLVEELANKVLILAKGKRVAYGTFDGVTEIANLRKGSKLEDIFIEITGRH